MDPETPEPKPEEHPLPIQSYTGRAEVDEHALVVLAMPLPCWIIAPAGGTPGYQLAVLPEHADRASAELRLYEAECLETGNEPQRELPNFSFSQGWACAYVLLLFACFAYQSNYPAVKDQYKVDSRAILEHGEYFRAATGLLLHGDVFHLLGNAFLGFSLGLLVAGSVGARLGWALIFASGFFGNLLNVYHYASLDRVHLALGASTAVFGAIGILSGFGLIAAFLSPKTAPWARAIIPTAGGLVLLGWFGFGSGGPDDNTDVMAHIFGYLAGLPLGFVAGCVRILAANRCPRDASTTS